MLQIMEHQMESLKGRILENDIRIQIAQINF